jgi:hypothetical protein
MGRNRLYGDDSKVYTYRGPKSLNLAIKAIAKRRGSNHTRVTYELLMEHPSVIKELNKTKKDERTRARIADSL